MYFPVGKLRSGLSDSMGLQNFAKPPRTILSDLHAQVNMPGSQLRSWIVMDRPCRLSTPGSRASIGRCEKISFNPEGMIHSIWIWHQGDPQSLIKTVAAPVVVASYQVKLAVKQRYQTFNVGLLAQRQVSDMKDNLFWANKVVPIFNDHFLPAIWTVAVAADVLME
jgi:hypothetical protein